MLLNEIKPSPFLTDYIRLYRIIDFHFRGNFEIPPKLYSPRPEHCLQFYPKDTETVSYPGNKNVISNKKVTVTGQHTILSSRRVGNEFLSFQVLFQPGAFFRLTGVSMHELSNVYMDAECIFGSGVRYVNEQLAHAASYPQMIAVAELFLSGLIKRFKSGKHSVDDAGKLMLLQDDNFNVDRFINGSCLCHRQFDRKFKERMAFRPSSSYRSFVLTRLSG